MRRLVGDWSDSQEWFLVIGGPLASAFDSWHLYVVSPVEELHEIGPVLEAWPLLDACVKAGKHRQVVAHVCDYADDWAEPRRVGTLVIEVDSYVRCVTAALHRTPLFKELTQRGLCEGNMLILNLLDVSQSPLFLFS